MRKLVIGLTGGIGAGKSLALEEFARLGARTVDLDSVARELSRPGGRVHRALVKAFGEAARDRESLAREVFSSPRKRRRLERITHPAILAEMARRVSAAPRGVVVVDAPLLFEGGHEGRFDLTMAVSAPVSRRLARVRRRDRMSPAEFRRRAAAQWTEERRRAKADLVIENGGSPQDFKFRLREYFRAFSLIVHGG